MTTPFDADIAVSTPPTSRKIAVAVLALPERCYRCGVLTRSIVGFLVPEDLTDDPDGFIDFDVLASAFSRGVSAAQLAQWGIGPIRVRCSRYRPEGYLSNGCISCDAMQGWFPLHEDLMEFLAEGGTYEDLIVGRWTARASRSRCTRGRRGGGDESESRGRRTA
jgi:hypothetical protein